MAHQPWPPFRANSNSSPLDIEKSNEALPLTSSTTTPILATGNYENNEKVTASAKQKSDSWCYEYITLIICTALFIGLGWGLHWIDGRPEKVWPLGVITPNTFAAILVAGIDGGMIAVVLNCLGQLKWIKYRRGPQSLSGMQKFDEASRRSFGALTLIFPWVGGFPAAVGIAVCILAYLVAPCVQQTIESPQQSVKNGDSFLNRSLSYFEWTGSNPYMAQATLPMKGAVYDTLYTFSADESIKGPYSFCPSGNCTWDPFTTLSVCSACSDITANITTTPCSGNFTGSDVCSYKLPLGNQNAQGADLTLTSTFNNPMGMNASCINTTAQWTSIIQTPPTDPIIRFVMMNTTSTENMTSSGFDFDTYAVSAFDCQLRYCIKKVSTTVQSGILYQNFSQVPIQNMSRLPLHTYDDDVVWEITVADEKPFVVSELATGALTKFLQIFTGELSWGIDGTPSWTSDAIEALWGASNVYDLMDSVALAMSTRFRAAPMNYEEAFNSTEPVVGISWSLEPHFHVRWVWMIVPLVVVGFSWIFFLTVVIQTKLSGAGIWKTSIYPLLFHGLCDEARLKAQHCETVAAMEKRAKEIAVHLRQSGDGSPILLNHHSEHSELLHARKGKRLSKLSRLSTATNLSDWDN